MLLYVDQNKFKNSSLLICYCSIFFLILKIRENSGSIRSFGICIELYTEKLHFSVRRGLILYLGTI